MPNFTPGPWSRNIPPATKYNTVFAGRNTHIAHMETLGIPPEEVEGNCNLVTAAPQMYAKLDKIATWLEALAKRSTESADKCRFETLNVAYRADAKNYTATAKDIRSILNKADGK